MRWFISWLNDIHINWHIYIIKWFISSDIICAFKWPGGLETKPSAVAKAATGWQPNPVCWVRAVRAPSLTWGAQLCTSGAWPITIPKGLRWNKWVLAAQSWWFQPCNWDLGWNGHPLLPLIFPRRGLHWAGLRESVWSWLQWYLACSTCRDVSAADPKMVVFGGLMRSHI